MTPGLLDRTDALEAVDRLLDRLARGTGSSVLLAGGLWCGAGAVLREAARRAAARDLGDRLVRDDGTDLAKLSELVAEAEARGIGVVAVAPHADHGDPRAVLVEARAAEVVRLRPLAPQDAERLAARLAPELGDGARAAIAALSGGRPGLLAMLLGPAADDRAAVGHARERLARILRGVVAGEGPDVARVFEAVALVNATDPPTPAVVGAIARLPHDELAAALDRLAALGLIASGPRPAWPQAGAAVLEPLPHGRRAALHRAAAVALADAGRPPAEVAAHARRALPAGDPWVAGVLREAATREREAGRHAEAAALLERAVEEPCPPGDRAAACAELWLARGHQRLADGDPAGARQAFAAGLDHVGDAPGTPLERELHAAHAAAEAFALAGMPDDELDRALTPPSGRQSGRDRSMRAHAAIIGARSGALPAERALELARWAIDGGALVAEDGVEAPAFSLVTATLHFVDALEESVALCTAALADAEARGSAFGAALARYLRAAPLLRLARLDEMRRDATAAAAGFPPDEGIWRYGADRLLALAALEEGDVAAAVELATRRMEDARAAEAIWAIALQTRATVRLAAGDLDGALADANEVGALVADTADNPNAGVGWRSIAARALTVLGERTEAVRLARAELRIARRFGAAGGIGVALVTLGIAERDRTTSLRALAEAVDVLAHSDCRLDACAARVELGAALRRAGRRGDARAPLTAALDVAERHGLVMLRDRAEHELRAAGARPRRRALAGVPSLTPSEERIARLAASGRSNPAIAAELFVSRKTVEYHLSNAYRKLGVRGRDGLAAALAGEPAV